MQGGGEQRKQESEDKNTHAFTATDKESGAKRKFNDLITHSTQRLTILLGFVCLFVFYEYLFQNSTLNSQESEPQLFHVEEVFAFVFLRWFQKGKKWQIFSFVN